MKSLSREAFFGISGALLLAGCEASSLVAGRSPDASRKALGTNVLPCANGCSVPPTPTPYKYSQSISGAKGTGLAAYNVLTAVALSSADQTGKSLLTGSGSCSLNSANVSSYAGTYSTSETDGQLNCTIPAVGSGGVAVTATNNLTKATREITVAAGSLTSASASTKDSKGVVWSVTVTSYDNANWTITISNPSATYTYPYTTGTELGQAHGHSQSELLAYVPHRESDGAAKFDDGTEVAWIPCCVCYKNAADAAALLTFSMDGVALGLAVFGGPPGIAAGLVTAGLSLGVGAFGLANVAAGRFYCHT